MKYIYPYTDALKIVKHSVDISLYREGLEDAGVVYEETQNGHLEEFYDELSTYRWFIIEGNGTFVIDDESFEVGPKDLVVVPPKKRIHYFGKLKMVLITSPVYKPENDHHVREVNISESPYV